MDELPIPPNPTDLPDAEWQRLVREGDEEWQRRGPEIQKQFLQVVLDALPPGAWARSGRYSREEERWFAQKLERMLYKPKLASGGPDERRLSIRMSRVAGRMTSDEAGRYPKEARALLRAMAGKCRETSGRYYVFKPLPDPIKAAWEKCKKEAIADEDVEARCISEAVLQGFPEWITDFVVEPLFVLVGINGTRYRVVRIRNVHGEVTGSLRWPAEEFASPKAMRIWLNNNANCANWAAGERELNFLGMDIGQALVGKEVLEVALRGAHYVSGLYFFEDCAIAPGGARLRKDLNGRLLVAREGLPAKRGRPGRAAISARPQFDARSPRADDAPTDRGQAG